MHKYHKCEKLEGEENKVGDWVSLQIPFPMIAGSQRISFKDNKSGNQLYLNKRI